MLDSNSNPFQPMAAAIAEEVARIMGAAPQASSAITHADLDIPYPVTLVCDQLGKRNRPMAYMTFKRNYLDTGILRLIDNPRERRGRYVRLGDWLALKSQIQQKKK